MSLDISLLKQMVINSLNASETRQLYELERMMNIADTAMREVTSARIRFKDGEVTTSGNSLFEVIFLVALEIIPFAKIAKSGLFLSSMLARAVPKVAPNDKTIATKFLRSLVSSENSKPHFSLQESVRFYSLIKAASDNSALYGGVLKGLAKYPFPGRFSKAVGAAEQNKLAPSRPLTINDDSGNDPLTAHLYENQPDVAVFTSLRQWYMSNKAILQLTMHLTRMSALLEDDVDVLAKLLEKTDGDFGIELRNGFSPEDELLIQRSIEECLWSVLFNWKIEKVPMSYPMTSMSGTFLTPVTWMDKPPDLDNDFWNYLLKRMLIPENNLPYAWVPKNNNKIILARRFAWVANHIQTQSDELLRKLDRIDKTTASKLPAPKNTSAVAP